MLYMLNDGISRLKYQDDGRGNGTMEFIDNFIWLGDNGVQKLKIYWLKWRSKTLLLLKYNFFGIILHRYTELDIVRQKFL